MARREDQRLLAGLGRFCDDIAVPGSLQAVFVRSPHADAGIIAIESQAARESAGVRAVLTGQELAAMASPLRLAPSFEGRYPVSMPPLPLRDVRMLGDPVAVVIADGRVAALDAAERVVVRWDVQEAVASIAAA
ncbi:MAG: xanthine dehydrogenase family protein molybdopterin-binding subunit, partial [Acetobacteraceae bacterium]